MRLGFSLRLSQKSLECTQQGALPCPQRHGDGHSHPHQLPAFRQTLTHTCVENLNKCKGANDMPEGPYNI